MNYKAYLALGSNLGDRENNLLEAITHISSIEKIKLIINSNIYETKPVGYTDQPDFLNMVVLVESSLEPLELLHKMQNIELELKRTHNIHWGPRTIDIDILLIDDIELRVPNLEIPHPRMFERAFVLIPLRDIYKDKEIIGKSIESLIEKCNDKEHVKLFKKVDY